MIAANDDIGPCDEGSEFLAAAERYAQQGLHVIPLEPNQKRPLGRLVPRGVHDATVDLQQIRRFWKSAPHANIGIATGPASDVIGVDVDPRHGGDTSFNRLEDQHGSFPDTCVVLTGRDNGRHLYFRWPKIDVRNSEILPGIEVKGVGMYLVAPPSVHPDTGNRYCGIIDVNFVANLPSWLLAILRINRETEKQSNRVPEIPTIASVTPSLCISVNDAIEATLPNCEGQRNRKLFDFVRQLKAIGGFARVSANELRCHVQEWHRRALPFISTNSFDITWADFVYAWPKAAIPIGTDPIQVAWSRAQANFEMLEASEYDDPRIRALQVLCLELQAITGESSFFLSCRDAGRVIGIGHVSAAKLLNLLVHDRILEVVVQGTKTRATRYRYSASHSRSSHAERREYP